jgi:hypothetical protein
MGVANKKILDTAKKTTKGSERKNGGGGISE